MKRVPQGIHHGADRRRCGAEGHDVDGGHGYELGKGAVAVHADDPSLLADMAVPGPALATVTANDVALRRDQLARRKLVRRHLGSDLRDLSGELVSDYEGRLHASPGPVVPVRDV